MLFVEIGQGAILYLNLSASLCVFIGKLEPPILRDIHAHFYYFVIDGVSSTSSSVCVCVHTCEYVCVHLCMWMCLWV